MALNSIQARAIARRRGRSLLFREKVDGYVMIAPWLIGLVVLTAGPMLASAALAFTNYDILTPPKFSGTANVERMLGDELFLTSLRNTAYYTFIGVPLHVAVALGAALLLNTKVTGIRFYRTAFYMPSMTPPVANALLWLWIYNPDFGLANIVLSTLHLPTSKWLWDKNTAIPSFILMSLWGLGSQMITFLAGLQNVPPQLHEAASIDGAGALQRFRHVTLPMLSPIVLFNTIIAVIGSFQVFTTAYIATNGGPENATLFYVLYLYRNGFEYFKMGYASALAWVLFLIVLVFTLVQFKLSNRWVYYEGDLRKG
ncbi:MAG TPA: sugar ABC transporter permease [Chloroflexota bacterium]|nr:sugar ABC transporter permease [Chloroflexota bacterium]